MATVPDRKTVKYLGLYLDRRLTWMTHIKKEALRPAITT